MTPEQRRIVELEAALRPFADQADEIDRLNKAMLDKRFWYTNKHTFHVKIRDLKFARMTLMKKMKYV